jgi:hypothetical protein
MTFLVFYTNFSTERQNKDWTSFIGISFLSAQTIKIVIHTMVGISDFCGNEEV